MQFVYICNMQNNQRTELSSLGEFGLIEHLSKYIQINNPTTLKGIGDDAAVIDCGNGKVKLVTTDMLTEGVHFDLMYTPLKHLGYKSVIVNLSDIYAMNGKPQQIIVSIALSNRFSLEAVEEIYAGILLACKIYNVDLAGGDTTSSRAGLTINITAIGDAEKEKVVYRNGAQINDLIVISGDLGAAYLGLQILEREKEVYKSNPQMQPELEGHDYLLERQLKPEARKDVIHFFEENAVLPTSMIDVSDGLASELLHICKQSAVGCNIYIDKIPLDHSLISAAEDFNLDPVTCALNGGEDYELLFTIKQSDFEKIKNSKLFSVIGYITDTSQGANLINQANQAIPIRAQGWDSLKNK